MIWPTDWPVWWPFAVCDSVKTNPPKSIHSIFRCSRNPLLDMHRYTQILAHIHRYQQILTSKKTKAPLYALSGRFTCAYAAISCPKTAWMGENISRFNRCTSIHICSYNRQKILWEYSHEHIVNIWSYREYPVNIMFKSREYKKKFPLRSGYLNILTGYWQDIHRYWRDIHGYWQDIHVILTLSPEKNFFIPFKYVDICLYFSPRYSQVHISS